MVVAEEPGLSQLSGQVSIRTGKEKGQQVRGQTYKKGKKGKVGLPRGTRLLDGGLSLIIQGGGRLQRERKDS